MTDILIIIALVKWIKQCFNYYTKNEKDIINEHQLFIASGK